MKLCIPIIPRMFYYYPALEAWDNPPTTIYWADKKHEYYYVANMSIWIRKCGQLNWKTANLISKERSKITKI